MILALHTGPKSAPKLALFETTGLGVAFSETTYTRPQPTAPRDPHSATRGTQTRPDPTWPRYTDGGRFSFAEELAAWEAALAAEVAEWHTWRDTHLDKYHQNAVVWHGTRWVGVGEGMEDAATPVHESPEEILALIRAAGGVVAEAKGEPECGEDGEQSPTRTTTPIAPEPMVGLRVALGHGAIEPGRHLPGTWAVCQVLGSIIVLCDPPDLYKSERKGITLPRANWPDKLVSIWSHDHVIAWDNPEIPF